MISAITVIGGLARGLGAIFRHFDLKELADFDPDTHLRAALRGKVPGIGQAAAERLRKQYCAEGRALTPWLCGLPEELHPVLAVVVPPAVRDAHGLVSARGKSSDIHPWEEGRDMAIDVLAEYAPGLEIAVERRLCFLRDLDWACCCAPDDRPKLVSIEERGRGVWQSFRLWPPALTGASVVLAEYVAGDMEPPWFVELLAHEAIPASTRPRQAGAAWLAERGVSLSYFWSNVAGVVRTSREDARASRILAQETGSVVFSVAPLLAGALVANLVIADCEDAGPRRREALQLASDPQHRLLTVNPFRPGVYYYKAFRKGGRVREWFEIRERTMRAAVLWTRFLRQSYGLPPEAPLPTLAFHRGEGQGAPIAPAPCLYQFKGRALDGYALSASVRLMLWGVVPLNRLYLHLLRYLHHVVSLAKGEPLEEVARRTKHHPKEARRYGCPTPSMAFRVAEAALRDRQWRALNDWHLERKGHAHLLADDAPGR